jgi:hypothetical protein
MKKIVPTISLIITIFFCTFFWDYISLPYDEGNTIKGEFYSKKYNPNSEILRFIFFAGLPLLVYLVAFIKINPTYGLTKNTNFFLFRNKLIERDSIKNSNLNYITSIFILFVIFEFLTIDFNDYLDKIDVHHDGTFLTAPLNYIHKDSFWLSTFYDYGMLGNNIGLIFYKIFGEYNLGSIRLSTLILLFFNKVILIFLTRKIVISIDNIKLQELFFIVLTTSILILSNYEDFNLSSFSPRSFILLLFTLISTYTFGSNKFNHKSLFLLGCFSSISLICYIDVGIYINFLIFLFAIYLLFEKEYRLFLILLLGSIFSWVLFIYFFSVNEFIEFFNQTKIILNISGYLLGLEYPQPFSEKSTRFTKALLAIIFCGTMLINFLFSKKNSSNFNIKIILIILFITSCLVFNSALMRTDTPHIKYSSGFYSYLIIFFIFNYIFIFFEKFLLNINLIKNRYVLIAFLSLIFFTSQEINFKNSINLMNIEKNIFVLQKQKDEIFLTKEYKDFIEQFAILSKNDKCVLQLNDDNALPYFLNKPTCTKYYVNAHVLANHTENNFLLELKKSMPEYIVSESNINWFKHRDNYPKTSLYVNENYTFFKSFNSWEVIKKNVNN